MLPALTIGAAASVGWLEQRGLDASRARQWYVEIVLTSDDPDARFELNIYPEEWGFVFRSGASVSAIRVTDEPFVHGADAHGLLRETSSLDRIGELLRLVEARRGITFARRHATVRSNLARASPIVRRWLSTI